MMTMIIFVSIYKVRWTIRLHVLCEINWFFSILFCVSHSFISILPNLHFHTINISTSDEIDFQTCFFWGFGKVCLREFNIWWYRLRLRLTKMCISLFINTFILDRTLIDFNIEWEGSECDATSLQEMNNTKLLLKNTSKKRKSQYWIASNLLFLISANSFFASLLSHLVSSRE